MRVVITHPEWGVYLGSFLGLGFWSLLDHGGQDYAVTFPTRAEAADYVQTWEMNGDPGLYGFVPVNAGAWASIVHLRAAGLEPLIGKMGQPDLLRMPCEGHA